MNKPNHRVVGSTAAVVHLDDWHRPHKGGTSDIDIWTTRTDISGKGLDVSVMTEEIMEAFSGVNNYATLDDLYTIKISHLPWPVFWWKHVNDALFLKSKGAEINQPLYELLKQHWKVEHGTKTQLSLYRNKSEFFDDAVPKEFDHDLLHELVSFPERPVYTTVLKDGEEVATDREKWLALPFYDKIRMLREEMNVIMCERWLLHDHIRAKITLPQAWRMSVEKTTTALTKGIYSEFICENLEHFVLADRKETEYLFKTLKGIRT
ncbi:hypothetical protein D3C87_325350 [compost metagenome]